MNIAISCVLACAVVLLSPIAGWVYREPHVVGVLIALSPTLADRAPSAYAPRHCWRVRCGSASWRGNEVLAMLAGA